MVEKEKFNVLDWFDAQGYFYKKRYLEALKNGNPTEAEEIRRDAEERYMDWVTDPLD